ncbi:MAG: hypothetical protein HY048_05205 [Acidobacteria bacterium]|nr:hypothetical protein [Acidobacteriota bacterium]
MTDVVQSVIEQIDRLRERGQRLAASRSVEAVRLWQQDCAALVNQLSGGSKAHWLSRAFSQAFLVRATGGDVVVEAASAEIVERLLDVLSQARTSVAQITDAAAASAATPRAPRFEFVHNAELRPVLERALTDGRAALDAGDARLALILLSSVLEAIITDALEHSFTSLQPPAPSHLSFASHQSPVTSHSSLASPQPPRGSQSGLSTNASPKPNAPV